MAREKGFGGITAEGFFPGASSSDEELSPSADQPPEDLASAGTFDVSSSTAHASVTAANGSSAVTGPASSVGFTEAADGTASTEASRLPSWSKGSKEAKDVEEVGTDGEAQGGGAGGGGSTSAGPEGNGEDESKETKLERGEDESKETKLETGEDESKQTKLESGEVVFNMENVGIQPTAAASQRIRGRLRLVKQESAVYLSWSPYTLAEHPRGLDSKAKGQQYAIRAVALSEIRSIRRRTPQLGWQYVIFVLNTGLAFPPLYFYDGGVRGFISALKQHTTLIKSHDEPGVYLVNDTEDPLLLLRLLDPPLFQYLESIDGANFFFCFRWLLILFKREFEFEDVLKLWERLWTCPMTKHFHLYICCAIIKKFRRKIMDDQMDFDVLVRFVNELSCRVDLDDVLQYAEALCLWAGKRGEVCMPEPVEEETVLIEGPETGDTSHD